MSIYYYAYFIKTQEPESKIKARFRNAAVLPDSAWVLCDFSDRSYPTGVFEPGAYFTKELSAQFGEALFICVDTRNDQFEYEHSQNGRILRKLSWITDGCQSTWEWVEGAKEDWEETYIFSEANFARTRERLRYDQDLTEDQLLAKEQELRSVWDQRQYRLGEQWPSADATIGMAIQKHFGLKLPSM